MKGFGVSPRILEQAAKEQNAFNQMRMAQQAAMQAAEQGPPEFPGEGPVESFEDPSGADSVLETPMGPIPEI